jgi:uncharacterized membrane protein
MNNFVHSPIGLIHITSAIVAMIAGAIVLLNRKATKFHKRTGYVYVGSMVILNTTAFLIYHLFGKFGPFHIAALFSTISILGGMVPMFFRKQITGWLELHYYFINWSVVGLYAAFWAETLTRLVPMAQFWPVVVAATAGTAITGSILIRKNQNRFFPATKKATDSPVQTEQMRVSA